MAFPSQVIFERIVEPSTRLKEDVEMGSNEMVSVIIPVYNVQPYLREALDSVIHQTYSNLEIIIIDDGSTDGSGRICDEYAEQDQRIRVIHQENRGLGNARNVGLDRMTGEIIAFLDSDDAYEFAFIEELKTVMDLEQADLALGKYTVQYTSGKMCRRNKENTKPRMPAGTYDRINMLRALSEGRINGSVWNKLYKRELWEEIRFLEGHVYEDCEVSYKIMNQMGKAVVVDDVLYLYRERPGSITRTISWVYHCDRMLTYSRVEFFIKENLSDCFSEKQIQKVSQTHLKGMMISYTKLFRIEGIDKKSEGEKLRQKIIETGKGCGMESCKIRTRVAYQMMHRCPQILRIAYLVYRPIRMVIYRLTGK